MEIIYEHAGWTTLWIFLVCLAISDLGRGRKN